MVYQMDGSLSGAGSWEPRETLGAGTQADPEEPGEASPVRLPPRHSVAEAVALLAELGDEAEILAGGLSLVPMMNFRLARPTRWST